MAERAVIEKMALRLRSMIQEHQQSADTCDQYSGWYAEEYAKDETAENAADLALDARRYRDEAEQERVVVEALRAAVKILEKAS